MWINVPHKGRNIGQSKQVSWKNANDKVFYLNSIHELQTERLTG